MTAIDRLSSVVQALPAGGAGTSAARIAEATIGEIGHRVLAWTGEIGGSSAGGEAWSQRAEAGGSFQPNQNTLAQRGDVFGLREMAEDIAGRFRATPAQEGDLRRALEGLTRWSMVYVAGLSGADATRQVAGLSAALDAAQTSAAGEGIDGVIARLETATTTLSRGAGL